MAIGRQDYNMGIVPVMNVYANGQLPWLKFDAAAVLSGGSEIIVQDIVPAGYKLHVVSYGVTADNPGINYIGIVSEGVDPLFLYFDFQLFSHYSSGSERIIESGNSIQLKAWNKDTITVTFTAYMSGFLELIS